MLHGFKKHVLFTRFRKGEKRAKAAGMKVPCRANVGEGADHGSQRKAKTFAVAGDRCPVRNPRFF